MKTKIGVKNLLFPTPTILVGADVNGKPNYITVAHCGIAAMTHITISLRRQRFTSAGIKANGTFSVNIPSIEMAKITDYCGLVSGKDTDKGKLFENFYGTLKTAPMIERCPVNMECRLKETVEFPTHELFIGEIVETYCDEKFMRDGVLDLALVQPLLFGPGFYWKLGGTVAKTFNVGKETQKKG